jgi:hypothetical protein
MFGCDFGRHAKTLREVLMLMALFWPFVSALVAIDLGRPTLGLPQERRALEKCGRVETTRSASDDEEGGW